MPMTTKTAIRESIATFLVWIGRLDALALELRIANSRVMGASAVNVTATLMCISGVVSLLGVGGSAVLTALGGRWLDYSWAGTFVVAWILIMLARRRVKKDVVDAAWLEIGGILMIASVFILFTVIVLKYAGTSGSMFLVMAFGSQTLNLLGRALLLWRRVIWLGKAANQ